MELYIVRKSGRIGCVDIEGGYLEDSVIENSAWVKSLSE